MIKIAFGIIKYLVIILMLAYTFVSYGITGGKKLETLNKRYLLQNIFTICIFTLCSVIIIYHNDTIISLIVYVLETAYLILLVVLYRLIYPESSRLVVNNMAMLLAIGFIMVERLAPQSAFKQFIIVIVATIIAFFVPAIVKKRHILYNMRFVLAFVGIVFLGITFILGKTTWGAKISVDIAGFSFQPSEFVKIIFVLSIAAILSKPSNFKNVLISGVLALIHVLILVASTDLGAALIFFMVYLIMLFIGTGKLRYLFIGLGGGSLASIIAYRLFSHVRKRVMAFIDPWSRIDDTGYQIAQSLFAIGTGGWFGMGLYEGLPTKIPVVVKDFVFSAIAEEFGMVFSICLILICFNTFIGIMRTAARCRDIYYKLIAVGFGTLYVFQCFLTIGGVTKFIPSTGVTLPFVSYGGSSILCSIIMFAIVQAVFILVKENEGDEGQKAHN